MANPVLGIKRHCTSCSENYYDFNKSPITCPHCNAVFDPEILLKSRGTKPVAAKPKKAETVVEADKVEEDLIDDIEEDDAVTDDDILESGDDLEGVVSDSDSGDEKILSADEKVLSTDDTIEDALDTPEVDDE